MEAVPDQRTQGEIFTAFRERVAGMAGSPISYMQPIQSPETRLPNGRMADGAVTVSSAGVEGAPPAGTYLAEDKSGDAFVPEQAQAYSAQLTGGNGVITTAGPLRQTRSGLIYTFDTESSARAAMATLQGLHPNIHVGYFTGTGGFVWLR